MAGHTVEGYWIFAGFSAVLAIAALLGSLSRLRRDRFIADTSLVRIRSAAQGYVRLEGRAGAAEAQVLKAPLSGRPCVWWDFRVDYKEHIDGKMVLHRGIERATSVVPFVLNDGSGECLVGPVGAEVTPTTKDTWTGCSSHPSGPPPFEPVLPLAGDSHYIYHEQLIAPDAALCVLGELRSHTEFGAVDLKTRAILEQWKHDQSSLLRKFDSNHDGHIDAGEWEAARAAAHAQAEGTVLHSPIERVGVVGQTTHGGPFLIAPFDGEHVIRRERRHAIAMLIVSVLFLASGIWALARTQQLAARLAHAPRQEIPTPE